MIISHFHVHNTQLWKVLVNERIEKFLFICVSSLHFSSMFQTNDLSSLMLTKIINYYQNHCFPSISPWRYGVTFFLLRKSKIIHIAANFHRDSSWIIYDYAISMLWFRRKWGLKFRDAPGSFSLSFVQILFFFHFLSNLYLVLWRKYNAPSFIKFYYIYLHLEWWLRLLKFYFLDLRN